MNVKCFFAASAFALFSVSSAQGSGFVTLKEVMQSIVSLVSSVNLRSSGQVDGFLKDVVQVRSFYTARGHGLWSRFSALNYLGKSHTPSHTHLHERPHTTHSHEKKPHHRPKKRTNWPRLSRGPMSF
ncbi:hypothetical protein [Bartonella sp. A05]|uniref:hypothetical protein n=1 Tax=Bartonella sp. A05 TaxID=2967261 RepID=UPI0022A94582|nr:hypothetical protein [Bartonella sp. A05]MCZ2203361.1 hypothetical protein [Bartonella sp. A05]